MKPALLWLCCLVVFQCSGEARGTCTVGTDRRTALVAPRHLEATAGQLGPIPDRPRLIVLADMGNEPDEMQQMLHLLICSNEVQLEGLLAVTGKFLHPEHRLEYKRRLYPDWFHQLIDAYAQVYLNLQLHARGWHSPEYLRSIVATGQTHYGVASTGEGRSSPGSRLITAAVTKSDPRPVHVVINAGSNTLAQALRDYRASHSPEEVKAFVAKLRVFENQAQDDAGAWICREFPEIHWIRSRHQTKCYGGPDNQDLGPHHWKPYAYSPDGQHAWARENIMTGHGALGALYPERKIFDEHLHFIEGGGTIPWMGLVAPGLTDTAEPSWGGWSGRYSAEKVPNVPSPFAEVAKEEVVFSPYASYTDFNEVMDRWTDPADGKVYHDVHTPIWPWRVAMWNDFKARMDWCVQPFAQANHHPVAALNGDTGSAILHSSASPGDVLTFDASGSSDPDHDPLRYRWWIYPEAGRLPYGRPLPLEHAATDKVTLTIPADALGKELHLILEVWDHHSIVPLVDYRRAVIEVLPASPAAAILR